MAQTTPTVRDMTLLLYEEEQATPIAVGSTQWFEWLQKETSTIFSFHTPNGSYTARKERAGNRRGGWYWKAYRKYQGRLHRAYLGKSEDLTPTLLNEIALILSAREDEEPKRIADDAETVPALQMEAHYDAVMTPFLETKLHPPRLPTLLVERSRLLTLLDRGQSQKLTLVHAPAGFGKTTLITQWIACRQAQVTATQSTSSRIASSLEVAWVSLDGGDNDPVRFWSSLIAACQTFQAHIGQTALTHLSQLSRLPFSSSSLEAVLAFLLNDLAHAVQQGILILEDYHLIEHVRIHETLAFFIEHLPASLHVVILTRSEPPLPLVRWRARGDLLEISSSQLRFSVEETTTFLQQAISQPLSGEITRSLHAHLEGWAAGLRLLALSVQGQSRPLGGMMPQVIKDIFTQLSVGSANHRSHQLIQEYFLSEVLARQPEPLQLFLLQTSMLSRLSGSLCDIVTGRQDSAEWLELIFRSGFFLEVLDSQSVWYRYHALFAETMRAEAARRLGSAELRRLSALASQWYEANGMLVEAIEAALAALDFECAASLIERLNERAYFSEYHTMRRWLNQIPEPLLHARPILCFLLAQARVFAEDNEDSLWWRLEPVEDLLQQAEEGWRKQDNRFQLGILYAFRATFTVIHGLLTSAIAYAHQALQFLSSASLEQLYDNPKERPAEWIEWHCGCLITLAMEAMQVGSFGEAHELLLEAYTRSLNNEDRVFTRVIGRMLGDVCVELGELYRAASYYQQTLVEPEWPNEGGESMFRLQTLSGLIRLPYERNELEAVEEQLLEVPLQTYRGAFSYGEEMARTKVELTRLLLLYARGEVADTQAAFNALIVRLQANSQTLSLIPDVLIAQARLQFRSGDLAAVEHTLNSLASLDQELTLLQQQSIHLLRARLLLAWGEAEEALSLLEQLLAFARRGKHIIRVLEIRLVMAQAYSACKRGYDARQQLSLVLSQTRNEGFLRLFLDEGEALATLLRQLLPSLSEKPSRDYVQSILRAFLDSRSISSEHANNGGEGLLLEPLSAQEQRVLRLLVAGRSNPEIAQDLIVSVNTVKGHVKNLYRKLNVNNRVQAGEVARHYQLI